MNQKVKGGVTKQPKPDKNTDKSDDNPPKKSWWDKASTGNKLVVVFGILGLIATVALFVIDYFTDEERYRASNRAKLVFTEPPTLRGPIRCDAEKGSAIADSTWHFKNEGNRDAIDAVAPLVILHVDRSDKTFRRFIEDEKCDYKFVGFSEELITSIAAGAKHSKDAETEERFTPPHLGEKAYYRLTGCLTYFDEFDNRHNTCGTYILVGDDGTRTFACTAKITGTFREDVLGQCAN